MARAVAAACSREAVGVTEPLWAQAARVLCPAHGKGPSEARGGDLDLCPHVVTLQQALGASASDEV